MSIPIYKSDVDLMHPCACCTRELRSGGCCNSLVTDVNATLPSNSAGVYGPSRTDLDYVTHYQRAMKIDIDQSMAALLVSEADSCRCV